MPSFEEVLERFWDADTIHGVHPTLTDAAIADAERELRVRLPSDYLALMRIQNGGSVSGELDGCPLDPPRQHASGHVSDHVQIPKLDGLGGPGASCELLRSEDWDEPDYIAPGLVLIGTPDGHEYLALDYRQCGPAGEPAVVWVNPELDTEDRLAPTFRAFLEGLRPSESFPSAIALNEWLAANPPRRSWPARMLSRLRGGR